MIIDRDIFAIVFVVVVVAIRCDEGVVRRRLDFGRSVGLFRSAGVGFLFCCHVVASERTAGGRQNYWCKIPFGAKRYHNSPDRRGRSLEREMTTTITARKLMHRCNHSVFNIPSQAVTRVFIAGGSTTRRCKFPVMPPNCYIYRIFHGYKRNLTTRISVVGYSWS